jgi:hypothetical protein
MTDPVEVIARAIDPVAWGDWGCEPPAAVASRRGDALIVARAALAALEGEGFRVFSIVPVKREPEPLVFEDD